MNLPRFIQIHTLHNYPAALLNRDDAGLAKRLPFGDRIRTRVSSQCLKRHWRVVEDHHALASLGVPMAKRSRNFADHIALKLTDQGVSPDISNAIANVLKAAFKTNLDKLLKALKPAKATTKKNKPTAAVLAGDDDGDIEDAPGPQEQKQATLLGVNEYAYLERLAQEVAASVTTVGEVAAALLARLKEERDNIQAMKLGSGLESALFGRMVTSDVFASRDASVYVAHSFTVHEAQVENDYFTVVDDLPVDESDPGSAGIFDTELASGLYYGYTVVDVPQLVANLEGIGIHDCFKAASERRELAAQVVHHLLHLIATGSPGAKRGSTAPFEWARFMLVEAGDWQPRSLAGAFQNALPTETPRLRVAAVERLAAELSQLDAAYGAPSERRFLALDDVAVPNGQRLPLAELARWVQTSIVQGAGAEQKA